MIRLVFWQNILAILQSAHIRELAAKDGVEVTLVVPESLDPERRTQGWTIPDFGQATIVVAPPLAKIEALIQEKPEESIHIFSGIRAFPVVKEAFLLCVPTQARMGLLVESQDFRGWRGLVRRMVTYSDVLRYGRRIGFILAMGEMGVRWYCRCGFLQKLFTRMVTLLRSR